MADDGPGRITHSQVITSTLVTVGYPETLDRDLDFCSEVLTRAVTKMKRHEQSINFHDVTEKERLRAIFVLNTMYEVEKKMKRQQQEQQRGAKPHDASFGNRSNPVTPANAAPNYGGGHQSARYI
jgi:hypothetical protein